MGKEESRVKKKAYQKNDAVLKTNMWVFIFSASKIYLGENAKYFLTLLQ